MIGRWPLPRQKVKILPVGEMGRIFFVGPRAPTAVATNFPRMIRTPFTGRTGSDVTAEAFRTDARPDGAYVAVTVTAGETTHRLRDGATLRPEWARGDGRGGPRGRGYRYNGGRCW